jgi:1-acyl-sn-glycerol-3-phosphate acyltransferase
MILKLMLRGPRLLWILIRFMVKAFVIKHLNTGSPRQQKLAYITHISASKILRLFNIEVVVDGLDRLADHTPCLILSNHLSYLDILFFVISKGRYYVPLAYWH